jgi:predicted secreted Zn-dependent protease
MHMFAATPPVLISSPVVVEATRYYEIKGRHEADLVKEMNSKGYRTGKTTYWGNTSTQVRWTFEVKKYQGHVCRVVNPKVSIRITTTLPKWNPPAGTSEVVIRKWQKLYAALQHHEGEHGQIARDEGHAYVALMRGHASDDSCERLKAWLDDEGNKIRQEDSGKDAELDRRTRHGVDEGVSISW